MTPENPDNTNNGIDTHGGAYIEGEVHTKGGDFIGRDQIVGAVGEGARGLVQVIETYKERELSQVEVAQQAEAHERQALADAVAAYVQRLDQQAAAAAQLDPAANPYKALLEYDLQDAPLFFGRTAATQQLLARLARDQLTVLHSESGAGKTSLLKAGLMPRLLAQGHMPLYLRPYRTPVTRALKAALLPARSDLPPLAKASLLDFLRQATALLDGRQLVVLIDQFEELFTVQTAEDRSSFVAQLAPCLDDDLLPVRWIFAVRGEWLSQLGTFRPQVRNPFENELLLRALSRAEAREVILEPAAGRSVSFEEALIERLLDDLGQDAIAPPQLQLVCSTLFEGLNGANHITQTLYDQAGGAAGILRGHLARVLQRDLPAPQRRPARRLLEALVTSQKRRALRPQHELAAELAPQGVDPDTLAAVLAQLVDSRLLRVAEGQDETAERAYELAHDYLLDEIELDPEVQARKAAQELLDQKLPYYTRDRLLLSADELAIVNPHRQALTLSEQAQALLRASQAAVSRRRRITLAATIGAMVLILGTILSAFILQSNAAVERANLQSTAAADQATAAAENARIAANAQAASKLAFAEATRASIAEADALEQRDEADHQRQQAEAQALVAQAGELSAQALLHFEDHHDLAMLLSIEAYTSAQSLQTRQALYRVWKHNPQLIQIFQAHTDAVLNVAFSPDGTTLASASSDGTIRLWNPQSGQHTGMTLIGHTEEVSSMAFSPDGTTLASGANDGTIRLWDSQSGQPLGEPLSGHTGEVLSVTFSPDGGNLASGSFDTFIRLWDLQGGQPLGELWHEGHGDWVTTVAFSPDGRTLASGSVDGTILVWDVQNGQPLGEPLTGDSDPVFSVAFSPDGRTLASGLLDGPIRLWDLQSGQPVGKPLSGHTDEVLSVAFSPDGTTLASGDTDGTIRLWDSQSGQPLGAPLTGHADEVLSVVFSPNGATLASGSRDGTIRLWDLQGGLPLSKPLTERTNWIYSVAFSPNGATIASGSRDGTIRLWDSQSGQLLKEPLTGHTDDVLSVTFSPNGATIASGSRDGTIRLWDSQSGQPLGEPLTADTLGVSSVAFSPVGTTLASGSIDGTLRLWDLQSRQPLGEPLAGHTDAVMSVVFSSDGGSFASASSDGTIYLWDVQSGQHTSVTLIGHTEEVYRKAFSPDGTTLASGSYDGTIRLWDVQSGQPLGEPFSGHTDAVVSVAFSPDGTTLASGSFYGTIRLWDSQSRQPLGEPLAEQEYGVRSMAFSPDGGTLASGSDDGTIRLWDAGPASWIRASCQRAGRNLTEGEWNQFLSWKGPYDPEHKTCPQWDYV